MRLSFTQAEEDFRRNCARWLEEQLFGDFADLRGITNLVDAPERRKAWERRLAQGGWSVIGWPQNSGGRGASLPEQVIFAEEYARVGAPNRLNHIGVELLGPTLLAVGTDEQKARHLPPIAKGEAIWCQGYSEPAAGSDLAAVATRARRDGDEWVIEGQKIWTSLAQFADMIFVLARTEERTRGRSGLSFLLVPLQQPGVTIRPIRQINGEAEFNEVFFDSARCPVGDTIGGEGNGWSVSNTLLSFERGISTLGQQMQFRGELDAVVAAAQANGKAREPTYRQRLAKAEIGLRLMRFGALRMLSNDGRAGAGVALTYKIQWATWRRDLGDLAMDILGQDGEVAPIDAASWPLLTNLYLYSRADTIYGGTNQIQRNLIAERLLGLPREARGDA